ncbi:MAG: hypothetical protein ABIJ09_01880 [Pseudomonadota bacterium]
MTTTRHSQLLVLAASLALLGACSKGEIQPADLVTTKVVDNKVELAGSFCTAKPQEERFPVKILLILDGSGSLQFTDEGAIRVRAVTELLNRYVGNDTVMFHLILFNTFVKEFPEASEFWDAARLVQSVNLDAQLQVAEVLTDYQAALSSAFELISIDAQGPEARNTKYVVLFFSDGQPSPVCCICEDESAQKPTPDVSMDCSFGEVYPAGGGPGTSQCNPPTVADLNIGMQLSRVCEGQWEFNICNNLAELQVSFPARFQNQFPDLNTEQNYNREFQILNLLDDMVELTEGLDVGAFQFHSIMLWNAALPAGIQAIVGTNYCRQSRLMRMMAERGGGEYREARSAEEIDFLQFDFTALKRTNKMRRVFVTNRNLVPTAEGLVLDSDGDGLSDDEEYELGIDPLLRDTDGDGYTDLLEVRYAEFGMNPLEALHPYTPCMSFNNPPLTPGMDPQSGFPGTSLSPTDDLGQSVDSDNDMLRDCEEDMIGTNPLEADSDHDTIPDGLELRFGLDPRVQDAEGDADFDGISNIEEVLRNLNPREDDPVARRAPAFRYTLEQTLETLDQRGCFDLRMRHITLETPLGYFRIPNDPAAPQHIDLPGYNQIQVYEVESPSDDALGETRVRGACYLARYVAPDFREPANGVLTPPFTDYDLVDLVDGGYDVMGNFIPPVMDGKDCRGIFPPCVSNDDCPAGLQCLPSRVCAVP